MKNIFYTIFFISISFSLFGQQDVQNTFFMYNQQLHNPGYVGHRDVGSFTGLVRTQWVGFEGAPNSQLLSFQMPVPERAGFGATIWHHSQGISNTITGSLAFSYKVQASEDLSIRGGLQLGFKNYGIDFTDEKVVLAVLNDPSISLGDNNQEYVANAGAGFFLTYKDVFYFGLSVPEIIENDIAVNPTNEIAAVNARHYYVNAGGKIKYNESIDFKPHVMLKYVENAPLDLDINASLVFNNALLTGISYRTGGNGFGESIALLLMYNVNEQFGIGAAYDFTLSEINRFDNGSFEFMLRYDLGKNDLENPRYF